MENNAEAIVTGKSLIPPGTVWILGLIIVRSILLVWTIWHSYLTSEELEVQWGTFGRQGVSLVGGSALSDLTHLDVSQMALGKKLRVFDKLTMPPPRAPGGWRFWNLTEWRAAQAQLDTDHRQSVIETIEDMHGATTPLAANANAADIAALRNTFEQGLADLDNRANAYYTQVDTLREEVQRLADQRVGRADIEDRIQELVNQFEEKFSDLQDSVAQALGGQKNRATTATSTGTKAPGAKAFPKAGTAEYRRLVREAGNRVLADTTRTVNFFEVAKEMGLDTDDPANVQNVEATVRDLNAKRFAGLRSGQDPTPDALLDALL